MRAEPTGRGTEVAEVAPTHCPLGHRYENGAGLVGWIPCACTPNEGHRTYLCILEVGGVECHAVWSFPPCINPLERADRFRPGR